MDKLIVRIHNQETDEIIDREMTEQEILQYQIDQETQANLKAEFEAKVAARQAIADRLGLTADELAVLLG